MLPHFTDEKLKHMDVSHPKLFNQQVVGLSFYTSVGWLQHPQFSWWYHVFQDTTIVILIDLVSIVLLAVGCVSNYFRDSTTTEEFLVYLLKSFFISFFQTGNHYSDFKHQRLV